MLDGAAARLVAADLLSRRPWTCAQLRARLERRGAPAAVAAAVLDDLTARGYLDDAAFARQWVTIRSARGYGVSRLRAELRVRGVAPALVDVAVAALTGDVMLEGARAVARRRLPALTRGVPDRRVAPRLRDYLLRRGFPRVVVGRVVRDLVRDLDPPG